ncbi:MAG: hypothetical protein CMF45_03630 [Legionellales bacterium]|nr:hypothetical protein [Legionellales bacterium]
MGKIGKKMIYLVVGNHTSFVGVWEQIEITLRTFKAMQIPIGISSRIKPNETNIIIEDFNSYLVAEMFSIKEKNPATKYILYVTEYLTQTSKNHVTLNCFSKKAEFVRKLFRWEYKICGDRYNLFLSSERKEKENIIRNFFKPILNQFAEFSGSSYGNEVMMARREACLDKIRNLFSLCISTTEAVLNGYSEYCDCPLVYLPVFVDTERVKENRNKSKKLPSIFFSGRLTPYRRKEMRRLGQGTLNSYPLEGGVAWNDPALLRDTKFKLKRLRGEEQAFGIDNAIRYTQELEKSQLAGFWNLTKDIYEYSNEEKTATYEIYIPQASGWPYSSPNRTVLSIESGFIPLDLGSFSDHDVNTISINVENRFDISDVLALDVERAFSELDDKITSYNELQAVRAETAKGAIEIVMSKAG